MSRQIEHAVAEQVALLDQGRSAPMDFRLAIGRIADASGEARRLVGATLERLRHTGALSSDAERLVQPFLAAPVEEWTVRLHRRIARPSPADLDAHGAIVIGRVLRERYVILEKLATGVRGTVFRALDRYGTSLAGVERQVALKVMYTGGQDPDQILQDLAVELREVQALSHRNIVKVFELDRDGDVIFFTMELLDGELLSDLLARMSPAPMNRMQAWQVIRQLGAGLQHAHERGVVHGDLTPQNVFITRSGELRILEFGSRAVPSRVARPPGISAYASCELLEGRTPDPCDDLYALSCIAYEVLTGAHPFEHRTALLARNFGVKAKRPEGLGNHQWKALRTGLAWHRAGRSVSVQTWLRHVTRGNAEQRAMIPLGEFGVISARKPLWQSRSAMASLAVALSCVGILGALSRVTPSNGPPAAPAPALPRIPSAEPALSPVNEAVVDTAAAASGKAARVVPIKPAKPAPLHVSVDGYEVIPGERFVEIRVRRNELAHNASFVWWTEPATAKQGVDYVHQANAIQTFPAGHRSTRFYVKLLPETVRSQRDFFYVAIAPLGHEHMPAKITRAQIWLPTPQAQLQASR